MGNTNNKNYIERDEWIHIIVSFIVFDDERGSNMLFVTDDDRVYGLGSNIRGSLGLGQNQYVSEPQEITELRNKKIQNFFNGFEFIVYQSCDQFI